MWAAATKAANASSTHRFCIGAGHQCTMLLFAPKHLPSCYRLASAGYVKQTLHSWESH